MNGVNYYLTVTYKHTKLCFFRNNIMELENLSCTDLKCSWKSQKNSINDHFSAVPVHEFCCAKQDDNDENKLPFQYRDLDENLALEIMKKLCEAAPGSAVALHLAGRGTTSLFDNSSTRYCRELITEIIEKSQTQNEAIKKIQFDVPIQACCLRILESLKIDNPVEICYNTAMNRKVWLNERKLRISGSRIYDLHTYSQNANANWQMRAQKFFWPQAVVNKFVKHGLKFENSARKEYSELFKKTVVECGFVIHPKYPWLGYTPDGVIFENGKPEKLLEIKCFYKAKDMPVTDCLKEIPYLDKKTGLLRQKHKYYGQIQMGMLILNLDSCDFVIYGSFDKSLYVLNVPFDQIFALEMVKNASSVYITKMLHSICLNLTKS